ncbi:maturation of Asn-linked oligosaccharides protein [Gryganskiella cystojenkinii]|nr:maturation of Asn-linked oligosaccharides protein [Gryganskiella cystojenkinii]
MRLGILAFSAFLHMTLAQVMQYPNIQIPETGAGDRDEVKALFVKAYGEYKKFAFGHDVVTPCSQSFSDLHNGWGVTIIDSMSTMYIMGLNDLFDEAVKFVDTIDFSKSRTSETVSVFVSSTRHLGGLLSAYEISQKKYPVLLQKARDLGDKLAFAWVGNNAIPFPDIDFATNTPTVRTSNIEEATGMLLEFDRLSRLTGNSTYIELAQKSALHVCKASAPLPGLPAQGIDPSSGESVKGYVTFGGGSSAYFYSILRLLMLPPGDHTQDYGGAWSTAVDSAIRYLKRTSTVGDWTYIADYDDEKQIRHISSHIGCFAGGDFAVGGKLFNNHTIVEIGLQLIDTCYNTYSSTQSGLGPETFAFKSSNGSYTGSSPPTTNQEQFYDTKGFYITAADYILRPEVLQSNLYAWRTTGDDKYYFRARETLASILKDLVVKEDGGVAGLQDVNDRTKGRFDETESFFFSGVLKYLYLTFDDPLHISLNDYVLSSEGHLFTRVPL